MTSPFISTLVTNPSQSAYSLSSVAGGSKTFVITLEEGVPVEISKNNLVDTASMRDVGVSTKLTVVKYQEVPEPKSGISLITSSSTGSGTSGIICLSGSDLVSYSGSSGYAVGSSSILVASSGSGERVSLTYDPVSYGEGTLVSPSLNGFVVSYSDPATVSDLGTSPSWTDQSTASDIVMARVSLDGKVRVCVRKNSALYETLLAQYTETADETCGYLLLERGGFVGFKFASVVSGTPLDFIPPTSPNAGIWTAFTVYALLPTTVLALDMLFSTSLSAGSLARVKVVSLVRNSIKRRCCKVVFSAQAVYSDSVSAYGGGVSGY